MTQQDNSQSEVAMEELRGLIAVHKARYDGTSSESKWETESLDSMVALLEQIVPCACDGEETEPTSTSLYTDETFGDIAAAAAHEALFKQWSSDNLDAFLSLTSHDPADNSITPEFEAACAKMRSDIDKINQIANANAFHAVGQKKKRMLKLAQEND